MMIRYVTQQGSTGERENWRTEEGITYLEVLRDDLGVNRDKFRVFVNDELLDCLDGEVENGDVIRLEPKNYSSGR